MKKLLFFLSIFTFILFITSCGGEEPTINEITEEVTETVANDDANSEETAADTSSTGVYQEEVIEEEEVSLQDAIKADATPEVEEGAMSFCDCVKKNKELTDKMMSDDATDAEFDEAMEKLNKMKTGDCSIMFPNQSNIEEKQAHQNKVNRCLK
jgi:hypothetical protein